MALKPTIYKARIDLSDLDREVYDSLNLTVAQHPSESIERMLARILAYCIKATPELSFTKGLSEATEPDIWLKTLDDQISLWVDVGEPAPERVKKATHLSKEVVIFSFNSKSDVWWQQNQNALSRLNADFYQFKNEEIMALANLVQRTMDWSMTITGNTAYINSNDQSVDITWTQLNTSD